MAAAFSDIKTLVVKIGTTLLTGNHGFERAVIEDVVKDIAKLKRERGMNVIIVSSGAMGCGMDRLGMSTRPSSLPEKQATAAVGQSRLMHVYEELLDAHGGGLHAAQVLLSARDLDDRRGYLNVRNTLNALFDFGNVIPIINENDSTATEEIRVGDNDTLSAMVASKINADLLIILSNVDGLYDKDPSTDPSARLVDRVEAVTAETEALASGTRAATSIGGMKTKLSAARIACVTGTPMVIANGRRPNAVSEILAGTCPMTYFGASLNAMPHRKRWIAFGRSPRGAVIVDDGAREALLGKGRSLLPAGVVAVEGAFELGEAVNVKDSTGREIARGLSNYASREVEVIKGHKSTEVERLLGYRDFDEVIHRDNLVIL